MVAISEQKQAQLRRWADRFMPTLISNWEALSADLAEMDRWDPVEQTIYIEEWRHREAQRADLEDLATQGVLAANQLALLHRLHELVAEYEPEVDRLLGVSSK